MKKKKRRGNRDRKGFFLFFYSQNPNSAFTLAMSSACQSSHTHTHTRALDDEIFIGCAALLTRVTACGGRDEMMKGGGKGKETSVSAAP